MKVCVKISFAILMMYSVSCREDLESSGEIILGTWENIAGTLENNPDLSYRNQLIFRADGTFEYSLQKIRTDDKDIIGYLSLSSGKYKVVDDKLLRYSIRQYALDNENQYLDRDELVLESTIDELPEIKLSFNKTKDELIFNFLSGSPCPGSSMCLEFAKFQRVG